MGKKQMTIGILTAGGDCPGLNAAIRGVAKTAMMEYGMKVIGISSGFSGLIEKEYYEITEKHLSGILTVGGTILGTSREKPFKKTLNYFESIDKPKQIAENYEEMGLDCLVCLGGNGTQKTAYGLASEGLNVIGIPKTIDNDVWGTDMTFGFQSAVDIAAEAIDRLHTTANSHKRIMVIELMGHKAGWITLYAGVAAGGDVILIPEIDYDIHVVVDYLSERVAKGKEYSIVVVAEGIKTKDDRPAGYHIAQRIRKLTALETRTEYGSFAAKLIADREFGKMVAIKNDNITYIPLKKVAGITRTVDPDLPLVKTARSMGTCFGDVPAKVTE